MYAVRPKDGEKLDYYYLTAIAVDFFKAMQSQIMNKVGWFKLPKNLANGKSKIVDTILQLRILEGNQYLLSQSRLIHLLHGIWGTNQESLGVHDNEKI